MQRGAAVLILSIGVRACGEQALNDGRILVERRRVQSLVVLVLGVAIHACLYTRDNIGDHSLLKELGRIPTIWSGRSREKTGWTRDYWITSWWGCAATGQDVRNESNDPAYHV